MPEVAKDPNGEGQQKVPKKGLMTGKYKWWLVGGMAVVAVLVFYFVRKSNANATGTTSGGTTTSMDPATQAALQSALQGQAAAGYSMQAATGPAGAAGPAGPTGPAGAPGAKGATGAAGKPPPVTHQLQPASSQSQTQYYTVRPGDSLSKIASQFKYPGGWQALYSANRTAVGSNPNLIHPGLRLKV